MDLARLRQETATEHARTEETVPLMQSSLSREVYASVLRGFFAVVSAWDHWADAHVPVDLEPLLAGRRRADLLAADLRALGEGVPETDSAQILRMEESVVSGDARSAFLGRMYVMEGSTLGGQYIARHVEEVLGLNPGQGNSYFVGYGDQTATRWKEFRAVLAAEPESEADTVIASAKNMFELFGEGMRTTASGVLISCNATPLPSTQGDVSAKASIRN